MLTSSPKTWNIKGRDFYQLIWLGTNQGIWWWCCDADFNSGSACLPCCLGKVPLKQDFSDIYLTTFLESVISEIQNLLGSSFFSKYLKFILDLKNEAKYWQKVLCLWDNCIWIGIVKLSLLRRGYFSSTTNVLTSSPKTWHVKNRDFFRLHWPGNDRLIWERCCDVDFNSALARLPCCFSKGSLKRGFLDIYLTTFSESVSSKLQNLWGSSRFSKYWKFILGFKNTAKNGEKLFCFWDNCISITIVKLSL